MGVRIATSLESMRVTRAEYIRPPIEVFRFNPGRRYPFFLLFP